MAAPAYTCFCATYVDVLNRLMFLLGLIVLFCACWMICWDPVSDKYFKTLEALSDVSKMSWAFFIAGLLVVCTACLGSKFVKNRRRILGVFYLVGVLVALIFVVFIYCAASRDLSQIADIEDLSEHVPAGGAHHHFEGGTASLYRDVFISWTNTFQDSCYLEGEKPKVPIVPNYGRRLSVQEKPDKKCTGEKKVFCDDVENTWISNKCKGMVTNDGSDHHFENACTSCVHDWWADLGFEGQEKYADLRFSFQSGTGVIYCRCVAALLDWVRQHAHTIQTCVLLLGILQSALAGATIWLVICGQSTSVEQEGDADSIELGPWPDSTGVRMQMVTCPPGAQPCTMVMVHTESGRMMQAMVPPGIYPGMNFQIAV